MATTTNDYEIKDFHKEVIEGSHQQPIVADFWAPWCGPCKMLSPALENMAAEANGRWKLAKVNVDENQEIAGQFGIRSIPTVVMFKEGEGIDSFMGVMPEKDIRKWIEKHAGSALMEKVEEAMQLYRNGQADQAKQLLEALLTEEPNNNAAKVALAEIVLFDYPDYARELTHKIYEGDDHYHRAQAIQTFARLLYFHEHPDELPDDEVKATYVKGLSAVREKDYETALKHFLEVIQKNKAYDDEGARKACIAIFNLLGKDHQLTQEYRRTFDRALY